MSAFAFAFLSLSMVMLMGNVWTISDLIIRKGVDVMDAMKIFIYFLPSIIRYTIPLSFLLGVLLAVGRLVADNEIVAINVAGVSLMRVLSIFLTIGLIFSMALLVLYNKTIPEFQYRYRSELKNIYSKNIGALIEPGIFLEGFQNFIVYISDIDSNKMKNVFIYELGAKEGVSKITFAKRGEFVVEKSILKMKLEDGFRDETNAQNKNELYRLNFKIFFMDIPIKDKKTTKIKKKPADMSIQELREKIGSLQAQGVHPIELIAEIHERLNFCFSIITFIILGFSVALMVRHREKAINFGLAFLIAGIYYLLFILGKTLVEHHIVIPSLGMWLPNIIILALALILLKKNVHFR